MSEYESSARRIILTDMLTELQGFRKEKQEQLQWKVDPPLRKASAYTESHNVPFLGSEHFGNVARLLPRYK